MSRIKRPLSRSVIIVCAIFIGLLCVVLSITTYQLYTRTMYDRYDKQLSSVLTYIEHHIDHDDMAECAATFVESEKYKEFQAFFDDFIDHYEDLHYLYIMKILDPEDVDPNEPIPIYEICAANSTYEKMYEPEIVMHLGDGEVGWYDSDTVQEFRDILKGDEEVSIVNKSEWGTDYTLARPLVNSNGEHYGLLCADISIDEINKTVYRNIYISIGIIAGFGVLFILLLFWWLHKNVTQPLKLLENRVTSFAYSSTGTRNPDELSFDAPEIHTKNEVEALSRAVKKLSVDMRDYVKGIVAAEDEARDLQEHVSEMNVIAYRDALTHVENKAAYEEKRLQLMQDVADDCAEFAIAMVDVNYLKNINDLYGHEHGDEYLIGACRIICDIFAHSPVYRIGGDEFLVVLQGRDYENRKKLISDAKKAFAESTKDKDLPAWNRYSAAIGVSVWASGDDVDTVFSRADQKMYEEKAKMKKDLPFD